MVALVGILGVVVGAAGNYVVQEVRDSRTAREAERRALLLVYDDLRLDVSNLNLLGTKLESDLFVVTAWEDNKEVAAGRLASSDWLTVAHFFGQARRLNRFAYPSRTLKKTKFTRGLVREMLELGMEAMVIMERELGLPPTVPPPRE